MGSAESLRCVYCGGDIKAGDDFFSIDLPTGRASFHRDHADALRMRLAERLFRPLDSERKEDRVIMDMLCAGHADSCFKRTQSPLAECSCGWEIFWRTAYGQPPMDEARQEISSEKIGGTDPD